MCTWFAAFVSVAVGRNGRWSLNGLAEHACCALAAKFEWWCVECHPENDTYMHYDNDSTRDASRCKCLCAAGRHSRMHSPRCNTGRFHLLFDCEIASTNFNATRKTLSFDGVAVRHRRRRTHRLRAHTHTRTRMILSVKSRSPHSVGHRVCTAYLPITHFAVAKRTTVTRAQTAIVIIASNCCWTNLWWHFANKNVHSHTDLTRWTWARVHSFTFCVRGGCAPCLYLLPSVLSLCVCENKTSKQLWLWSSHSVICCRAVIFFLFARSQSDLMLAICSFFFLLCSCHSDFKVTRGCRAHIKFILNMILNSGRYEFVWKLNSNAISSRLAGDSCGRYNASGLWRYFTRNDWDRSSKVAHAHS